MIFNWLVFSVVSWTASSIRVGREDIFNHHLRSYADCMAGGYRRDHDCNRLRMNLEAEISPVLEVITFILVAFLNFVTLFFVIQFQTMKNSVRQAARKFNSTNNKLQVSQIIIIISMLYAQCMFHTYHAGLKRASSFM